MRNKDLTNDPIELKKKLQSAWGDTRWRDQQIKAMTKELDELRGAMKEKDNEIGRLYKYILEITEKT